MRRLCTAVGLLVVAVGVVLEAAPPTLTGLSPVTGTSAGGTQVTITGTGLTATSVVAFGGANGTVVGAAPDGTALLVSTPAHANGQVNVVVTNANGTATLANGFTYITPDGPPPTVTNVSPNKGSTLGGTAITITGTNFRANASVTFGSAAATGVSVVNGSTITATVPAATGGSAAATNVTVTNTDSTSGAGGPFNYVAVCDATVSENCVRLQVNGLPPPSGVTALLARTASGTQISIVNNNNSDRFELSPAVTTAQEIGVVLVGTAATEAPLFALSTGDIQSQGFQWDAAAKETTVIVKPRASSWNGPQGCQLPPGTCAPRASADYAALALLVIASPAVPANAPANFAANVRGLFLSTNAQTFSIPQYDAATSAFTFSVGAPSRRLADTSAADDLDDGDPDPDGDRNDNGFFNFFLPNAFITNVWGIANPALLVSNPAQLNVSLGGATVTPVVTAVAATLTSPAGVKIAFEGFHYSVEDVAVTIAPTVSSISPATGYLSGGTLVIITGLNFRPNATVTIGGTAATGVSIVNATMITALLPAHAAGAADVVVTNSDGSTGTLAGGFTYHACTGLAPASDWVCVNGGWVPPGHPLAAGGSGGSSSSSGGSSACTSPQPAANWTCVNGGWVPPGFSTGSSGESGGSSSSSSSSSSVCTSPQPAATWSCVNGGWVPPGFPGTSSGSSSSGGTSSSGGSSGGSTACTSPRPAADWVCVNGGWVPPGHPLARGGS
jgi:IPT/TIG domain-containing protein